MATKTFKGRIQNKHDTEANWNAAVNFKPLAGELIIYDEDNAHSTPRFKVGDGNTLVNNLPFYPSGDVTAAGDNTFTGMNNTFTNHVNLQGLVRIGKGNSITILSSTSTGLINVNLPSKAGTLALTDDIDVTAAGNNTFTGSNTFTFNEPDGIYRTLINKSGVSVGGGIGIDILTDTTYGYSGIKQVHINNTYTYTFPSKSGTFATMDDIPNVDSLAKLAQDNTFTGNNIFTGDFSRKTRDSSGVIYYKESISDQGFTVGVGGTEAATNTQAIYGYGSIKVTAGASGTGTLYLPVKTGTVALTSDIDVTAAGNNTFTGTNTYYGDYVALGAFYPTVQVDSGILKVGQVTSNNDTNHTPTGTFASSTDYGNGGITYRPNTTTHITYMLPSQAGTLALKSDIPIKTATLSGTTLSITLS